MSVTKKQWNRVFASVVVTELYGMRLVLMGDDTKTLLPLLLGMAFNGLLEWAVKQGEKESLARA